PASPPPPPRRRRPPSATGCRRPPTPLITKPWGCGGRCPPQGLRAAGAAGPPTRRHEGGDRPRQGFAPGGPRRRRHGCLWRWWLGAGGRRCLSPYCAQRPAPAQRGGRPSASVSQAHPSPVASPLPSPAFPVAATVSGQLPAPSFVLVAGLLLG